MDIELRPIKYREKVQYINKMIELEKKIEAKDFSAIAEVSKIREDMLAKLSNGKIDATYLDNATAEDVDNLFAQMEKSILKDQELKKN